jgi:hypothetical protein
MLVLVTGGAVEAVEVEVTSEGGCSSSESEPNKDSMLGFGWDLRLAKLV